MLPDCMPTSPVIKIRYEVVEEEERKKANRFLFRSSARISVG